jgi:hypothetical protein
VSCIRLDYSQGATIQAPAFTTANVRLYGHSFVAGADASRVGVTDFPSRIGWAIDPSKRLAPGIFSYSFLGHGGYRTGQASSGTGLQLAPLAATEVDPFIQAGKVNIHLYMETINSVTWYQSTSGGSLSPAATTAQTIADLTAYFLARRAAGWKNGNLIGTYCMYPLPFWTTAYQQCVLDINTWIRTTAIALGLIDFYVDLMADPELAARTATTLNQSDLTHPTDYGHLIIYDLTLPALLAAYESQPSTLVHTWTPALLQRMLFWVGMEQFGKFVLWDGSGKVFQLTDQSGWGYNFAASGALRPTWNRVNKSVDTSGGQAMTTSLNVEMDYAQRVNVFANYNCTSTATVMAELGPNATTNTDAWVITNETGGPKIASYGNVGQSNARASTVATTSNLLFTIDHSISSGQGNLLLEGAPAPGLTRTDAPNTNFLGNHAISVFGRATGLVPSTAQTRLMLASTKSITAADITNLLAYEHAQFG